MLGEHQSSQATTTWCDIGAELSLSYLFGSARDAEITHFKWKKAQNCLCLQSSGLQSVDITSVCSNEEPSKKCLPPPILMNHYKALTLLAYQI